MNFTDVLVAVILLGIVLSFGLAVPSDTYKNMSDSKDNIILVNSYEEFRDIVKEKNLQVVSTDVELTNELNKIWNDNGFEQRVSPNTHRDPNYKKIKVEGKFIPNETVPVEDREFIKVVFKGERISQEYYIGL